MLDGFIRSIQDDKFSARILTLLLIFEVALLLFYFYRFEEVIDTFWDIRQIWVLYVVTALFSAVTIIIPICFYFALSLRLSEVDSEYHISIWILRAFCVLCNVAVFGVELLMTQSLFEVNQNNIFSPLSNSPVAIYLAWCMAFMIAAFHQVVSYFTFNRVAVIMKQSKSRTVV